MEAGTDLFGPGLGETQRWLLVSLKRRGPSSIHELGADVDLAPATLREHLQSLAERGLVERHGARRTGPGRPEVLYRLARAGESLFPRQEGQVLRHLARYLVGQGQAGVLAGFIQAEIAARMGRARARVESLDGAERLAEVARILSEEGYMAEVAVEGPDRQSVLKRCHCPIRDLVAVTDSPCRAEIAFIEELLGKRLVRTEFLPDGGRSCSYAVGT